ncbi:unnamed protein product [Dracunculus medinensis]|uniref:Uncharacterized protein n=1 Tax=Dracunculus medinensis TaxID=318479 RepID=A0A3P7PWX9_DRAME|nr:unnamed protein product [Dracunculus medinensis]
MLQRIATTGEERRVQAALAARIALEHSVNADETREEELMEIDPASVGTSNRTGPVDENEDDFDKMSSSETQSRSASTSVSRVVTPEPVQEPSSPMQGRKLRSSGRRLLSRRELYKKARGNAIQRK